VFSVKFVLLSKSKVLYRLLLTCKLLHILAGVFVAFITVIKYWWNWMIGSFGWLIKCHWITLGDYYCCRIVPYSGFQINISHAFCCMATNCSWCCCTAFIVFLNYLTFLVIVRIFARIELNVIFSGSRLFLLTSSAYVLIVCARVIGQWLNVSIKGNNV